MAQLRRLTHTRMKEVLRRQDPSRFGSKYAPFVKAAPEGTLQGSAPDQGPVARLDREVLAFSDIERRTLEVLAGCPVVVEILEQEPLPWLS